MGEGSHEMSNSSGGTNVSGLPRRVRRLEQTLYDPDAGMVQEVHRQGKRIDTVFSLAVATTFAAVASMVGIAALVVKVLGVHV